MREEFEKWFDENMYLAGQCFCTESEKRRMLKAWTASRAAIEIKLPNPEDYHCSGSAEAALIDVSAAITSHGIRIKGK